MLRNRRKANLRRTLCVELLEDRTLLTGNVTSNLSATGLLTLTGDAADNSITIQQAAQTIFVIGNGTTVDGAAFGQFNGVNAITVLFFDGNVTVLVEGINIPGAVNITEGTGNDTMATHFSTIGQLLANVGRKEPGATGNITADVSNVITTGLGTAGNVTVNLENQSGVRGPGPGSLITATLSNVQCANGGDVNLTVADGITYFGFTAASTVQVSGVSTTGNLTVLAGDHIQKAVTDNSNATTLSLTVGNDNDIGEVANNTIGKTAKVNFANNTPNPSPVPAPSVTVSGNNIGSGGVTDGLTLQVANNTNHFGAVWLVRADNNAIEGNLKFAAGNGIGARIDPTGDTGGLDITMGSGGVNGLESLTMLGVTSGDPQISFNSNVGDIVNITLTNILITDPHATLNMHDNGRGVDHVNLCNVQVAVLFISLSSSGHNVVNAKNVTTHGGFIFGGSGFGNHYHDLGGNSGFNVFGFSP